MGYLFSYCVVYKVPPRLRVSIAIDSDHVFEIITDLYFFIVTEKYRFILFLSFRALRPEIYFVGFYPSLEDYFFIILEINLKKQRP